MQISHAAKGTKENLEKTSIHVWQVQLCKQQSGTVKSTQQRITTRYHFWSVACAVIRTKNKSSSKNTRIFIKKLQYMSVTRATIIIDIKNA